MTIKFGLVNAGRGYISSILLSWEMPAINVDDEECLIAGVCLKYE